MPKRKKGGSTNSTSDEEQCSLCCKAIVEDRDEALFCEGSCNKWMHRYCAGVSLSHYEALQDSTLPFLCSLCVQTKHSETIEELKATIAALREEVKELHGALERSNPAKLTSETVDEPKSEWTTVVQRTRQRPARRGNNGNRVSRKQGDDNTSSPPGPSSNSQSSSLQKSPVSGVRRVWGTLPYTTPGAVSATLKKLTSVGNKIAVKRKTRKHEGSGKTRWWFLLKSDENVLKKLDNEWESIQLQTKWKLECCSTPRSKVDPSQNCAENASTNTTTSDSQQPLSSPGPTDASTDNANEVLETQHNDQTANSNHPNNTFLERSPTSQQLVS